MSYENEDVTTAVTKTVPRGWTDETLDQAYREQWTDDQADRDVTAAEAVLLRAVIAHPDWERWESINNGKDPLLCALAWCYGKRDGELWLLDITG